MYLLSNTRLKDNVALAVVGCGGTGSLVAEGLCRLLLNHAESRLVLVDHDRVEERNIGRQNFQRQEVGRFKSQALAERLSRSYGREVLYATVPWSYAIFNEVFRPQQMPHMDAVGAGVVIGCVDNAAARAAILESLTRGHISLQENVWWLDAGNGVDSGQVFIGNAPADRLAGSFLEGVDLVKELPFPTVVEPALLAPASEEPLPCAQAVAAGEQSPTINQAMATLVLEYVRRLLQGTLPWMATYLDLYTGSMRPVLAEPEQVARLTGAPVRSLVKMWPGPKPCPRCGEIHGEGASDAHTIP